MTCLPALDQFALDAIALVLQVGRGGRKIDEPFRRRLGSSFLRVELAKNSQHLADLIRQIVNALMEALFQQRAERLVELADASRLRVLFKKLEAEQAREQRFERLGQLARGDRRLDDFEQPRLLLHPEPAGFFGSLPEP